MDVYLWESAAKTEDPASFKNVCLRGIQLLARYTEKTGESQRMTDRAKRAAYRLANLFLQKRYANANVISPPFLRPL
ncbi:hypothetical protein chiPu_0001750 [Chiloscyllium punctatum]|uniref:Uncharacterized protein n=1 Tax=Chiloscyllium punctatum TaxID=137246 RepID=A0A401RYZ3_CHIPU|nr:hypothetical protein [Chiloscyllium punctatum]